jgi:DNA adenine methylase
VPESRQKVNPLLKWCGSKRRIYQNVRDLLPNTVKGKYIEPFFGGGAVFFEYLDDDLRRNTPAVIADANPALINFYQVCAESSDALWHDAQVLFDDHADPLHYYRVRDRFNDLMTTQTSNPGRYLTWAACFAYLNRAGFNGLWRVHQTRGTFNVPRGSYKNPQLPPLEDYHQAGSMLSGQEVVCGDYKEALYWAAEGDVVYADPPYVDTFTGYAKGGFGDGDQRELSDELKAAAARGAHVVLSINDCPLARELYAGSVFTELKVRHAVGAKEDRRRDVAELLIVVRP